MWAVRACVSEIVVSALLFFGSHVLYGFFKIWGDSFYLLTKTRGSAVPGWTQHWSILIEPEENRMIPIWLGCVWNTKQIPKVKF